jgi:hypothetical protein
MNTKISKLPLIAFLLIALLSSQFLIVQYQVEHLLDGTHHDHDDSGDICEICVIAKKLSQEFLLLTHVSTKLTSFTYLELYSRFVFDFKTHRKPFHSQAPPYFSHK